MVDTTEEFLHEMGKRISKRRKELNLTQAQLAEKAEITGQTISTSETGSKALKPWNIVKICSALGVSADYLLRGKTSDNDLTIMSRKVSKLPLEQYRHLENIINSFLAAVGIEDMGEDNFQDGK